MTDARTVVEQYDDRDAVIAGIAVALRGAEPMSLVHVHRVADGRIASLRDCSAPERAPRLG